MRSHHHYVAVPSPGINFGYSRFLKIIRIIVSIIVAIAALYCYVYYIHIDENTVSAELARNNSISLNNDKITLTSSDFRTLIKISNRFARRHNFNGIYINDTELKLDDTGSKFYYTIDSNYITIRSNYLIKPSNNHIKFVFGNEPVNYNLTLAYAQNFENSSDLSYWHKIPNELVTITREGLRLHPIDSRKASSLIFRRGYEKNVVFEVDFMPHRAPLNFSLIINLGTSIFLGINDNHTIEIIQAKYTGKEKTEKRVLSGDFKFQNNEPCKAIVEVNGDEIILTLKQGERTKSISYIDPTPQNNVHEKYKNPGIAVWRNGSGITVQKVAVRSDDLI